MYYGVNKPLDCISKFPNPFSILSGDTIFFRLFKFVPCVNVNWGDDTKPVHAALGQNSTIILSVSNEALYRSKSRWALLKKTCEDKRIRQTN